MVKKASRHPLTYFLIVLLIGAGLIGLSVVRGSGVLPDKVASQTAIVSHAFASTEAKPKGMDTAALDARVQVLMADPAMAGMAVAVVENGEITFMRGYGVADRATGERVTEDTVFRWASVSKGAAATLAYKLAEKGELSLSKPLSQFNTNLRLPDASEMKLNLTDLLSHRVGIAHNAEDQRLESGLDPAGLRRALAMVPLQCEPGACYSYQNIAYDATSEIVSNATGRSLEAQVTGQLFRPLGMASAGYGMNNLTGAKSWARPYRRDRLMELVPSYFLVPAAAGVSSNIHDLARWMQAQMGEQTGVVSQAVLNEIHRPRVATDKGRGSSPFAQITDKHSYGQGWRSMMYDGHWLVHHGGAVNGYRAAIMFDPVRKSGIVMLWNSSETRPYKLQYEFLDLLYERPHMDWLGIDDAQIAVPLEQASVAAD